MSADATPELGSARCPGLSWDDLADRDSRDLPAFLRADAYRYLGSTPLDAARYTSDEFFAREVDKMWPHVWQFAARGEDLPEPGDYVVYENAGRSYLITRQADGGIRAFHNVCLHRGRSLRVEDGHAEHFRCPYHGFTWNIDGSLNHIPCRWDFQHLNDASMTLPEVQTGLWGGYIFIKETDGGPTLDDYLSPLPDHFQRWPHDHLRTAAWAAKVIPVNWKAAAEAFMEAFHVVATHPQLMPFTGDANSKYFIFADHVNLAITPTATPSPHLDGTDIDEMRMIGIFVNNNNRVIMPDTDITVADGQTARAAIGEYNRKRFAMMQGRNLDHASDCEVQDSLTYNVFPNFSPWGGYGSTVVYRWRPWPDQDHCLMEVRILRHPLPDEEIPLAKMQLLEAHESFAGPLGQLGAIIEQDLENLPHVQRGMRHSRNRKLQLGNYQEVRIRHFHQTLDMYLDREEGAS